MLQRAPPALTGVGVLMVAALLGLLAAAADDFYETSNIALEVNYNVVQDQLRVCNQSTRASDNDVDQALGMFWNSGAGKEIAVQSCSSPGVRILDETDNSPECDPGDLACSTVPSQDSPQLMGIWLTQNAPQSGTPEMHNVIAHELGHTLGFCHTNEAPAPELGWRCPGQLYVYCPDSLMASGLCHPPLSQLPQGDIDRYFYAYSPDAVISLSGYSTYSPPYVLSVSLSWNPAPVHSENQFEIYNRTGGLYYRATEPKNANASTFVESGRGWIWEDVETQTNATPYPYGAANWVQVEVGVAAPTNVALSAYPSADDLRLEWRDNSDKEGWYEARLWRNGSVYDTKTLDPAPGHGTDMSQQWYDKPAGAYTADVRACAGGPQLCSDWIASGTVTVTLGSLHFIVKAVDASGYVLGNIAGATAKLTNTSATYVYDTQISDPGGWVRFNNVTPGTYGILAYKNAYVGKAKQHNNCVTSQYTTSGATIQYGGYTAAWDNSVPVPAGGPTYCYDLGLMCQSAASCYPTNHFQASAYDRVSGVYLGGWEEGDLGSPTNNKTMVFHSWGDGQVAFGYYNDIRIVWRGKVRFPATATYKFILCSDDGSRVGVNIVNDSSPVWDMNFYWDHADSCITWYSTMTGGTYFPIKLEWYDHTGAAGVYFEYQRQ